MVMSAALLLSSVADEYPRISEWLLGSGLISEDVQNNGIHLSVWIIVPLAAVVAARRPLYAVAG